MAYALTITHQTLIMFILMLIGYICYHIGLIDSSGSKQLSNIVIYIANPALLIQAFSASLTASIWHNAGITAGIIIGIYVISIILIRIVLPKTDAINQFAIIFGNLGFVGIPLAQAVLGQEGVFYMSIFVGISNFVIWTYGLSLVSNKSEKLSLSSVLKLLLNPCIVALFVGIIIAGLHIKLPAIISATITDLSNINLPLVMIALGCYLAEGNVLQALKAKQLYTTVSWRLITIPLVLIVLLFPLPQSLQAMRMTLLLGSATPAAALMAIFSKKFGGNYLYSTAVVSISTIASLVTIPIVLSVAKYVWSI